MNGKNDDTRETSDQEFGAEDAVYRGMPASFAANNDEETFTLNELEGDIDRGLGPSSGYEPRSVQVASYREEDSLSFVESYSSSSSASSHHKQYVDSNVAAFSSASMDAIVPEPQLVPPAPFHLDLNTHDVPKIVASATKIHTMLRQTFDDHHVDVLFKPNQWLFVAKAYPNNELVNFRVCLYNTNSNAYKLEFQLLDGDRLSYHSLLNQIKSDLNLPTHVSFGNSPHFNASSSPSSSSTTHANVPSEENIKQMVKMIDSKYVDVKIEGLKLSHKLMCRNKISLPTFVTHSGIAAVLTALDSERSIMEVQRCGAAALNMYCEMDHANECHYLMKTSNGLKILKRLALMGPPSSTGSDSKSSGFSFFEEEEDDDEDLTHLEVQRQAASALLSLARRSSTVQFVEDIGGRQLFSSLEKSGDPRLSQIAREGLRHVSATRTHY